MFRRRAVRPRSLVKRQNPHPLLKRANDMLASGDYLSAATAFEDLADRAVSRNGPAAPHLLIQTGKAKILAGLAAEGVEIIKKALGIFIQRKEWMRFQRTRSRTVDQLSRMGLLEEAKEMENFYSDQVPGEFSEIVKLQRSDPTSKAVARLPLSCPGCGGPIRSDKVEWVDEMTAECPYCGSMLRD